MIAYHGTIKKGLSVLKPFAHSESTLKNPYVYLTTYKPLAALYIWNKDFKWFNYGFDSGGTPVYTESFPNALKEFYGGVSGCIYICEGEFENGSQTNIGVAVLSQSEVCIKRSETVSDVYELLLEYERQGLLRINRYKNLTEAQKRNERRMALEEIRSCGLLQKITPLAKFMQEKFPDAWQEAKENQ